MDYKEPVPINLKRRIKRKKILSLKEKVQLVHKVLVQHQFLKDVAKEYHITQPAVSNIVRKAKKNPRFLDELFNL